VGIFCALLLAVVAGRAGAATLSLSSINNTSTGVTANADSGNDREDPYNPANDACSEQLGGSDSNFMRLNNTGTASSNVSPGGSTSVGFQINAGVAADSAIDGQDEYERGKIRYTLGFNVTATAVEDWTIDVAQNVLGLFAMAGDGTATAVGTQVDGNAGISTISVVANGNNVSFNAAPTSFSNNSANNDEASLQFSGSRSDNTVASGTGNASFSVTISFDIDAFSNAGCTGFICSSASGGEDAAVLMGYDNVDDCCGGTVDRIRADNYSTWGRAVGPDGYNSTWTLNVTTECGNGVIDAGEACDDGALTGTSASCCTAVCQLRPAQEICRPSAGPCDLFEACTGLSGSCPADGFEPPTTVCRSTSAGDICDAEEFCTGSAAACPADDVEPLGTTCRASASSCDAEEVCDGAGKTCPANVPESAGTECRAAGGVCDVAEQCDGSSFSCPVDMKVSLGTECRGTAGVCDVAETCNGVANDCPVDQFTSGTECRISGGVCDVAESCDGSGPNCPTDQFASGNECRVSGGVCDVAETCDGSGVGCPADVFASGNECRASAGVCDVAESCDGSGVGCPADVFASGNECRADTGQCDVAETCDGSGASCPADLNEADGTMCDDGMSSTEDDQCIAGMCVGTVPPGLDPYKCYKAKDLKSPAWVKTTIGSLVDQFGAEINAYVGRPFMDCIPAELDGVGIDNPDQHLVCFKTKAQKLAPRPHFEVTNELGTLQLEASKSYVICIPSSAQILP